MGTVNSESAMTYSAKEPSEPPSPKAPPLFLQNIGPIPPRLQTWHSPICKKGTQSDCTADMIKRMQSHTITNFIRSFGNIRSYFCNSATSFMGSSNRFRTGPGSIQGQSVGMTERSSSDLDQNIGAFRFGNGNCLNCIRFVNLEVRTLEVIDKYLYDTSCTHLFGNCHPDLIVVGGEDGADCGVKDLITSMGK